MVVVASQEREKIKCNLSTQNDESYLKRQLGAPHLTTSAALSRNPIFSAKTSQDSIIQSVTKTSGVLNSPKALNLEMEVFGDLSGFCRSPKMDSTNLFQTVVDELNTPVFEKALFDYDRHQNSSDPLNVITSTDDLNFKYKSELSNYDNVNIEDNLMINQDSLIEFKEGENKNISNIPIDINNDMGEPVINYIVISGQGLINNESNVLISNNENIYHSDDKVTPIYNELINNDDDEFLPTVHNCSDIFFKNDYDNALNDDDVSTQQYIVIETATPFETPDTSRSPSEYSDKSSPGLSLNINHKLPKQEIIETPDIIDTIDAIENEKGFNLFDFINEENGNINMLPLFEVSTPPVTHCQPTTQKKFKRKHKRDDDDDYEPPISVRKTLHQVSHKAQTSNVNSSDDEDETQTPVRRGRPPKRNVSISSEGTEGGKYREMRDKNNEASRKSRLKRKVKESAVEIEAGELEDRNIKLKAQVAELERTVTNFRNNLMKILLSK